MKAIASSIVVAAGAYLLGLTMQCDKSGAVVVGLLGGTILSLAGLTSLFRCFLDDSHKPRLP